LPGLHGGGFAAGDTIGVQIQVKYSVIALIIPFIALLVNGIEINPCQLHDADRILLTARTELSSFRKVIKSSTVATLARSTMVVFGRSLRFVDLSVKHQVLYWEQGVVHR
jgi:hypothetical protein